MREFRVWCKDRNEWETHGTCIKSDGTILHLDKGRIMPLRPDTHMVEFYTGLNDKNGKKIFEGDIIQIEMSESPFIHSFENFEVGFTNGRFCATDENNENWGFEASESEVIGNKHDPESE